MKILEYGRLVEGLLDYHRPRGMLRLDVRMMQNVAVVDGQFFVRNRSIRLVADYVREVGFTTTVRKILSRSGENRRNTRILSVGIGTVLEGDSDSLSIGAAVAFVAPSHPEWVSRVVLPPELCLRLDTTLDDRRVHLPLGVVEIPDVVQLTHCAGWDYWSGLPVPEDGARWLAAHHELLVDGYRSTPATPAIQPFVPDSVVTRRRPRVRPAASKPTLSVIGSGNYVKTVALPNLGRRLALREIFEVDPLILTKTHDAVEYHCAPGPEADEMFSDAYLVAGYHHTHAPIAERVLVSGRWAIVEKPIATTKEQLAALAGALRISAKFFACYQKRHDDFTALAQELLGSGPVDYSCIVFEVPLPRLHWYTWPNSGTRVLSNGCHWIDHFLWLNRGSDVQSVNVVSGRSGTVQVWIELSNSASFSMVLTEKGSARIGLQDIVDLRAGDKTVQIRNSTEFTFDSPTAAFKRRQLRIQPYRRMYSRIATDIAAGFSKVDIDHEVRSADCVLRVEEAVREALDRLVEGRQ